MVLRFVGIDPDSFHKNCPSVWVDDATGDVIVQGWEVTDGAMLAEVAAVSPIADHEKVVRVPARMRAMLREACGGGAVDL